MGIYRLLLAVAVLCGHAGVNLRGHAIGVSAVVSFFLLSGYVMTALIERYYATPDHLGTFYIDRAMRLFPQFALYCCLTLVLIAVARPSSIYLSGLNAASVLFNAVMLPLNFTNAFPDARLIPQAWSLGLECQFYILMPLLIIFRLRALAFAASFAFFLLPYFGILNADVWGYRLLPGTLFMFLFGSYLYSSINRTLFILAYAVIAAMFAWLATHESFARPYNFEVLFGLLLGVPIVWMLSKATFGRWEAFVGNLSYGVFLNQFFVFWSFQALGVKESAPWYLPGAIVASIFLAMISYAVVERPVINLRRALRARTLHANSQGIDSKPVTLA